MKIQENWTLKEKLELTNGQYIFNFAFEDFDTCSGLLVYNNSVAVLDENELIIGYLYQNGVWVTSSRTLEIDDDLYDITLIKFLMDNKELNNKLLMVFYQNKGESIVVDKTVNLEAITYVEGNFLKSENISNIIVDYSSSELLKFNYVYIPSLHRYYYLTSYDLVTNRIYRLALTEDVLYTYKDKILEQSAYISRTEDEAYINKYLPDSETLAMVDNVYEIVNITDGDGVINSEEVHDYHILVEVV